MEASEAAATRRPYRTLVVDDDESWRFLVKRLLHRTGRFEVVAEAGDGAEAIARAEETEADVVLLDLRMPGMTGEQALPEPCSSRATASSSSRSPSSPEYERLCRDVLELREELSEAHRKQARDMRGCARPRRCFARRSSRSGPCGGSFRCARAADA
jgi:hypothetical protein